MEPYACTVQETNASGKISKTLKFCAEMEKCALFCGVAALVATTPLLVRLSIRSSVLKKTIAVFTRASKTSVAKLIA